MKQFEIELQRIMNGDKAQLYNSTKTCNRQEKEKYFTIINKPFFVQRAPGSFGVDLLMARGDICFLVEVKSSIHKIINLGTYQLIRQYEKLKDCSNKYKIGSLYFFRRKNYKGDCWRVFAVPCDKLEGRQAVFHRRLPKVQLTRNGTPKLDFNEGIILSDLISYICK